MIEKASSQVREGDLHVFSENAGFLMGRVPLQNSLSTELGRARNDSLLKRKSSEPRKEQGSGASKKDIVD